MSIDINFTNLEEVKENLKDMLGEGDLITLKDLHPSTTLGKTLLEKFKDAKSVPLSESGYYKAQDLNDEVLKKILIKASIEITEEIKANIKPVIREWLFKVENMGSTLTKFLEKDDTNISLFKDEIILNYKVDSFIESSRYKVNNLGNQILEETAFHRHIKEKDELEVFHFYYEGTKFYQSKENISFLGLNEDKEMLMIPMANNGEPEYLELEKIENPSLKAKKFLKAKIAETNKEKIRVAKIIGTKTKPKKKTTTKKSSSNNK